jgi:hypothetical protein
MANLSYTDTIHVDPHQRTGTESRKVFLRLTVIFRSQRKSVKKHDQLMGIGRLIHSVAWLCFPGIHGAATFG